MPGHLAGHLVGFIRALRHAGLGVTTQQAALFAESLTHVGIADRLAVRDAARATLARRHEHVALLDEAFERFWRTGLGTPPAATPPFASGLVASKSRPLPAEVAIARRLGRQSEESEQPLSDRAGTWSASEVLRHKRFDRLDADETTEIERLMGRIHLPPPERITRRYRPAPRGRVPDWRGTMRAAVRHDGEIVQRRWRNRTRKARPLVLFADVSGSMERYTRMLLYFLHGLVQRSRRSPSRWTVDVFVFGTRLTRITRALSSRNVDTALDEVSQRVADWSGGTRIGSALHTFNREWSRRVLGHGAIVALISDGWDQGEPDLVSRELARLRRSTKRLVWLNPLADVPGYVPKTAGLLAAQPFVDDMLPAGSLSSLERAMSIVAGRPARGPRVRSPSR